MESAISITKNEDDFVNINEEISIAKEKKIEFKTAFVTYLNKKGGGHMPPQTTVIPHY